MEYIKNTPCSILRGGTSKGVFFLEKDIPPAGEMRDRFLLAVMGSPDPRQIDGLGGATSVTSKIAIVAPSLRDDADIDYTFAQVSVDKPIVSYKGNCGNISSAVGPYAIEKGLVSAVSPITSVRIYNTNTQKVIVAEIEVQNGRVKYDGSYTIPGVPGTAAPVKLKFCHPAGTVSTSLLPTGNVKDALMVPGFGAVCVSIVDATNPLVFAKAKDLHMDGGELPFDIDSNPKLLSLLETVRGLAAVKMGLIENYTESAWKTPTIPKMTIVSKSHDYMAINGEKISAQQVDLVSRMMSMQKAHPTYAMTGAMCTAAAAVVPGSVVQEVLRPGTDLGRMRIGNPSGVMEAGVDFTTDCSGIPDIIATFGFRTANFLMNGEVRSPRA
ncbi:MAG: 3-methylitaconate isomerase [Oscillospiraceae bacterium]|nr:3-methylitaconate isomerase [Oscillospiraceae bacterium]MCI2191673.1 3-methylitaconate isomerase [Oscillospiraceae bacterium]